MKTPVLCAALALTACATPIPEKAAKVQVHSQMSTLLGECKRLGPVSVTETNAWQNATMDAKVAARSKVADLGGDTLVITNIDQTDSMSGYTTLIHGTAMRCY